MNSQINALLGQAVQHFEQGKLGEAEQLLQKVLQLHAKNFDALHILGVVKGIQNDKQEAIKLLKKAVSIDPGNNFVHFNLAKTLSEAGKEEESLPHHKKATQLAPQHAEAWLNYGRSLNNQGRFEEALACYEHALSVNPYYADAWSNYGATCNAMERYEDALSAYDKALAITPEHAESWSNSGVALQALKRHSPALAAYQKALAINPALTGTWINYGLLLIHEDRLEDALAAFDNVLRLAPDHLEAWLQSSVCFVRLHSFEHALAALESLISLAPDHVTAWIDKGVVQARLGQLEPALQSYQHALQLDGQSAQALYSKGLSLRDAGRHQDALQAYSQARALNPALEQLQINWLRSKMLLCDWQGVEDEMEALRATVQAQEQSFDPFLFVTLSDDPVSERLCAELHATRQHPDKRSGLQWPPVEPGKKIKIGYYSADFHNHATTYLMAELFEKHDRDAFELIGFSYGPDISDYMRQRVSAAMDSFIDVRHQSDAAVVAMSRDLGIDIAVDLKGYTRDSRMGIFSHGAAPVQVSYLGYPGTLGAPYIDYIIGDKVTTPDTAAPYYVEQIIRLPHSYQINDRTRSIAEHAFTRQELDLPEDAFVFACFNSNYKITPQVFGIWMAILNKVPGSVLWLFNDSPAVSDNLRAEAEKRGIAGNRLVFAPHMELASHLARHRQADLFLDTYNYNAHTTASDALWAGLPVLTRLGNTFSSRVAASLLNAVGLPELITTSVAEYEELAVALASDRERLASYRQRLLANRLTTPLFDSGLFTRHIEDAYRYMHQRRIAGLPPAAYDVPA
ncbi:tetratricopeptide repeat protein [Herbaspirillum rhizosphaerae]|uniref:protein O-GlcNAc transferase n=1 Tax=Herbaspirillum rhizosphaerae TaxID=346179 RepID=A0ABW8ZCK5_9BURK